MSFIYHLDEYLFDFVITDWLSVHELSLLDVSIANHRFRQTFLHYIRGHSVATSNNPFTSKYIQWLILRGIKVIGNTLCNVCYIFESSYNSDCCSKCSLSSEELEAWHLKYEPSDVDTDLWLSCGVHSVKAVKHDSQCFKCNVTEDLSVNRWCCNCRPITCMSCALISDQCPLCNSNKYGLITKDELKLLLESSFQFKSRLKVAKQWVKRNKFTGQTFKFTQLICKAEDINEVVNSLVSKMPVHEYLTSIYSFVVDPWNIDERLADRSCNYAYCYKQVDGTRSYAGVLEARMAQDTFDILGTVIQVR